MRSQANEENSSGRVLLYLGMMEGKKLEDLVLGILSRIGVDEMFKVLL